MGVRVLVCACAYARHISDICMYAIDKYIYTHRTYVCVYVF